MRTYPPTAAALFGIAMLAGTLAGEARPDDPAGRQAAKDSKAAQLYVRLLGTSA